MQLPNDVLENPNRRRYHVVVGSAVLFTIYTIVLVGVRTVMN